MKQQKWGIVGGGIMGLTLAHRLAQKGYKVTLFEAAPEVGGLASSWKIHNFEWDKFYHVILLSDLHTRNILKELRLDDKMEWVETKTGFYTDGKLYSMSNTVEFLKFPPLGLIDKFRLGLTIFVASKLKNWKRLERIPVETWLKRWSGKNTFTKIWLPLLRAKLGESYKQTSTAFIWATIQRMYAARRSGLKKEMFGYVRGGYGQILKSFEAMLVSEGVEIKTNYQASEIFSNVYSGPTIKFTNGYEEQFDRLISTLPSRISVNLCKGLSETEIQKHRNIEYLGVICASVVLDIPISPYYVTNITDTWVPFTGVIEMSSLVDKKNFGGDSLLYLPKYLKPGDPLFDASDQEIEGLFLGALQKMYPFLSENNIKYVGIARARNVFALSTLGYSDNLPEVKTSVPGFYILNSAHITNGTLNVNETIQVAEDFMDNLDNYDVSFII
jgi:protoporphyrinogen oxidase